jgi:hypothetical protein
MTHKYGIYQSTSKSCILYKQDEDGKQSTFNIFVTPSEDEQNNKLFAFIDNEQMKKENWTSKKNIDIKQVMEAFGGWAEDAPIVFELEAQKSMSECLGAILKKETTD